MRIGISKPLIFVVISLLVALVYSSMSAFNVFAAPNEAPGNAECKAEDVPSGEGGYETFQRCCWTETDPGDPEGIELYYCQQCTRTNCGNKYPDPRAAPTPPPSGPVAPLQGGVLEQPPTPPPFDPTAPLQGGVLQQQEPPTPPPSGPAAPLQGGVLEQLERGDYAPWFAPGFLQQQEQQQPPPADQGAAELPPATKGSQPAIVEEEPPAPVCQEGLEFNEDLGFCVPEDCPEGQELNEETGICVLEEQPAETEEPQTEEPQTEEPQTEEPTEPQSNDEEQTSDQEDSSEDNNSNN